MHHIGLVMMLSLAVQAHAIACTTYIIRVHEKLELVCHSIVNALPYIICSTAHVSSRLSP